MIRRSRTNGANYGHPFGSDSLRPSPMPTASRRLTPDIVVLDGFGRQ